MGLEILSELLIIGALIYFWFSFITLKTTLILFILLGASFLRISCLYQKIKRQGILNKLSHKMRTILLERSLFDILCDIWYFEALKRHIRIFLGPFFIKKSPEEIIESFAEMNPSLRQVILRKGTINILPDLIKQQLTQNYIIPEEDQIQIKQNQLENTQQQVFAQEWDRYPDYEEFVQQRKKRVKSSQTLLHVLGLLVQQPIADKMAHQVDLIRLNKKSKRILVIAVICIIAQLYWMKSSRNLYWRALKISSWLGLMGITGSALGVYIITNKKQKQI